MADSTASTVSVADSSPASSTAASFTASTSASVLAASSVAAPTTANSVTPVSYTKAQLVNLSTFPSATRTLFSLALNANQTYTIAEAQAAVTNYERNLF